MVLLGDPIGIPENCPVMGSPGCCPVVGTQIAITFFCSMGFDLISYDIICIYTNYEWKSIEDVISLDTGAYTINIGEVGISACFSQTTSLFVYRWLNIYIYVIIILSQSLRYLLIQWLIIIVTFFDAYLGGPSPTPSRMPVFWLGVTFETVPTWNDQSA